MTKLIIGVHANEGAQRVLNPHVPWTPDEIGADAAACQTAGASMIHFHGRTEDGGMDHSAATYGAIARAVRARSDLLLLPSLANVPGFTLEQRLANVGDNAGDPQARADFLSMEMGCAVMDLWDPAEHAFVSEDRVFVNSTATTRELFRRGRDLGMRPWMASFNVSWTRSLLAHIDAGEVKGPPVATLVHGGPGFLAAHPATPAGLGAHLEFLPSDRGIVWTVSAYGGDVLTIAREAIERGGHVAIGVGDYEHAERGCPPNAELVNLVADLGRAAGREVATPNEARQILGLTPNEAGA